MTSSAAPTNNFTFVCVTCHQPVHTNVEVLHRVLPGAVADRAVCLPGPQMCCRDYNIRHQGLGLVSNRTNDARVSCKECKRTKKRHENCTESSWLFDSSRL